jgi:hypothetical protein
MIEMSCPRCGAGGRVPRDKVNARLVCKKCLQVFHLNKSHHPVIGEPPIIKEVPKQRAPREGIELDLSGLGGLGEKLAKIKLPDPKTLGIVAGVLLVVGLLWWIFSKESIEKRSDALIKAIRHGDVDVAVNMALPGTEMDAMKWLIDVHKEYLELKLNIGNFDPGVKVQVQTGSDGSGSQSLLEFSREGATSSGPTPDTWGTWRIDAKRTAENATRSG